ncbi:hypothetical protein O181_003432 [Austropuccinia psidii MF-1]|uniref:Uncharacterized protein n=1 Tax=Austropuccinia psidii MF-1 TaxID=1389203 RepID=A0A9Q3BED3_9BASI|nr:hypothetical protein [Austropuccinia psidii MF-1]
MPITHKSGNINKNSDGLSRCELANTPDKSSYVPLEAEPQISIEVINITNIGTEFFQEFRDSYKQEKNSHIFHPYWKTTAKTQLWSIHWMKYGNLPILKEDFTCLKT